MAVCFFFLFFFLLFSFTFIYFLACTGGVHVLSEDDFQEPVLSFHHAALRKEIQVGRLGSRSLSTQPCCQLLNGVFIGIIFKQYAFLCDYWSFPLLKNRLFVIFDNLWSRIQTQAITYIKSFPFQNNFLAIIYFTQFVFLQLLLTISSVNSIIIYIYCICF